MMTSMKAALRFQRQRSHDVTSSLTLRHSIQARRWPELRLTPHLRPLAIFALSHMHTRVLVHSPQLRPAQYTTGIQTGDRPFLRHEAISQVSDPSDLWESWRSKLFCSLPWTPPPPKIPPPQTVSHTNI